MKELYLKYCEDKSGVWAASAQRSEPVRLNRLWHAIDGDASKLWAELVAQGYHRNAAATYWTRVSAFWDWAMEHGHVPEGENPYKRFKAKNPRIFRGAYVKNPCKQTFDEIMGKLETISDPIIRNTCIVILVGALRWHEVHKIDGEYVVGKGNKRRKVYLPTPLGPICKPNQYSQVLRTLKAFGLTPHKLRSARLTDLARKGMTIADLTEFAGWSNFSVAQSYIAANESRIKELTEQRTEARVGAVMGVLKIAAWAAKKVKETV